MPTLQTNKQLWSDHCGEVNEIQETKYHKHNMSSYYVHDYPYFCTILQRSSFSLPPLPEAHGSGLPCRHLWTCCFLTELSKEQRQISPDPWCCTSFLIFGHVLRWQQRTQQLWQIKHPWRQGLLSQKLPSMWPTWLQYGYDMATASWGSSDINQET